MVGTRQIAGLGSIASIVCAVHCALMPIVLFLAPTLSETLLHDPALEWGVLGFIVLVGGFGLLRGFRVHGRWAPTIWASLGFLLFAVALLAFHGSTLGGMLALSGGLLLAFAQLHNVRIRRRAIL